MSEEAHPLASVVAGLAMLVSGAQVRWLDSRPETRQRVYFSNHTSHLDAAVLWASLPPQLRVLTRPVAAREYWEKGPLRRFLAARVFRAVLVERPGETHRLASAREALDLLVEALGDRYSLILFPEGTRGTGESLAPFRSGLYHLGQRRSDLEFLPVYLNNLNRILPKGEVLPVPLLSTVTFGPPLRLEPEESKQAFLDRARAALLRLSHL